VFADWLPEGREAIIPKKSITFDHFYFLVILASERHFRISHPPSSHGTHVFCFKILK